VFDLPVTYRRAAALVGARFPYAWQDGRPARVGLLGRGAPPRWFPVRPGYVFHAVNAYEDGERVVVDGIRPERAFDPTARPVPPPTLWRWTLDLDAGTATEQPLSEVPMELPAVDPRVSGRQHRYVFGARMTGRGDDLAATALVRHDMATGTTQIRPLDRGCTAGQPVFVPRPPAAEGEPAEGAPVEGDGWLLAVGDDQVRGRVARGGGRPGAGPRRLALPGRARPGRPRRRHRPPAGAPPRQPAHVLATRTRPPLTTARAGAIGCPLRWPAAAWPWVKASL